MSVRVTDKTTVALYCSATGVAFGPVFDSEDDAEAFLAWVEPKTFLDVRVIPRGELVALFRSWSAERQRDGDLSDTARFGAGA